MTGGWSYWPCLVLAGTGLLLLALAELLRRADQTVCDFANLTHTPTRSH